MSIKILTQNSIDNTNIDGARQNHFSAGMRSGVVKGAFNEGKFFASASDIIALDSCELRISGHQIVIDNTETITLNDRPSTPTKYSMIAEVQVNDSSIPSFRLFVQPANVELKEDNLFKTQNGNGTYQLRIGNFTLNTDGSITDVFRIVDVITGGEDLSNYYNKKEVDNLISNIEVSGGSGTYDLIITTQSEFDSFYASLDAGTCTAKSVAFVGDGGSLEFTRSDGKGLHLPATLKRLDGINSAKIAVSGVSDYNGAIWYDNVPTDSDYSINNLIVSCESNLTIKYSFKNCYQLYNCKSINGSGFYQCNRLINCDSIGVGGFLYCNYLINCNAEILDHALVHAIGFSYCEELINCYAHVSSMDVVGLGSYSANGFQYCTRLNNCNGESTSKAGKSATFQTCTYLTNCYGDSKSTNGGTAYVYDSCSFISSSSGTIMNGGTSVWGGSNSKRDDDSCSV